MTTATEPPRFDPLDASYVSWPYDQYAALRDEDPVHWSELLWGWVVTRYDDVAAVLRDPSMSSDIGNATPTPIVELELAGLAEHVRASRTIVHLDDPDHSRVRRLMAEPFRVRQVSRLASLIEQRVTAELDDLRERRGTGEISLDLIGDLAYPLPVDIFSEWLGVPEEANPQFRYWTSWVARSRDVMSAAERDELYAALDGMYDYLAEQAEAKRRQPADDLLSYLVHAEDEDDRLSDDELMSQLITLYMAGHEPTAGLVGNGVLALLRHPDQLARLRAEPDLMRNTISELLRYDGPNQFVRRITTRPTVLGEVEVPAGAVLYVGLASANRDPRHWGPSAGTVLVDRPDADQHLQFGGGAHSCIGSHFARLQAQLFLTAILDRLDGLELDGEPVWSTRMFIRGLQCLPVRCSITAS
ncbi:MAG: cytochrome P450 [Acidimicrobiales bacterium]